MGRFRSTKLTKLKLKNFDFDRGNTHQPNQWRRTPRHRMSGSPLPQTMILATTTMTTKIPWNSSLLFTVGSQMLMSTHQMRWHQEELVLQPTTTILRVPLPHKTNSANLQYLRNARRRVVARLNTRERVVFSFKSQS